MTRPDWNQPDWNQPDSGGEPATDPYGLYDPADLPEPPGRAGAGHGATPLDRHGWPDTTGGDHDPPPPSRPPGTGIVLGAAGLLAAAGLAGILTLNNTGDTVIAEPQPHSQLTPLPPTADSSRAAVPSSPTAPNRPPAPRPSPPSIGPPVVPPPASAATDPNTPRPTTPDSRRFRAPRTDTPAGEAAVPSRPIPPPNNTPATDQGSSTEQATTSDTSVSRTPQPRITDRNSPQQPDTPAPSASEGADRPPTIAPANPPTGQTSSPPAPTATPSGPAPSNRPTDAAPTDGLPTPANPTPTQQTAGSGAAAGCVPVMLVAVTGGDNDALTRDPARGELTALADQYPPGQLRAVATRNAATAHAALSAMSQQCANTRMLILGAGPGTADARQVITQAQHGQIPGMAPDRLLGAKLLDTSNPPITPPPGWAVPTPGGQTSTDDDPGLAEPLPTGSPPVPGSANPTGGSTNSPPGGSGSPSGAAPPVSGTRAPAAPVPTLSLPTDEGPTATAAPPTTSPRSPTVPPGPTDPGAPATVSSGSTARPRAPAPTTRTPTPGPPTTSSAPTTTPGAPTTTQGAPGRGRGVVVGPMTVGPMTMGPITIAPVPPPAGKQHPRQTPPGPSSTTHPRPTTNPPTTGPGPNSKTTQTAPPLTSPAPPTTGGRRGGTTTSSASPTTTADRDPGPRRPSTTTPTTGAPAPTTTPPAPTDPGLPAPSSTPAPPVDGAGVLGQATDAVWAMAGGLEGWKSTPWNNQGATDPSTAPSPNVPGRQAIKFEMPSGGKRTEAEPDVPNLKNGETWFVGYSGFFDPSFPVNADSWQLIMQFKEPGGGSPPLAVEVGSGQLRLANGGSNQKNFCPVQAGAPFSFKLRVTLGGSIDAWCGGQKTLTNYTTPEPNAGGSAYIKVGIYRDPSISSNGPSIMYLNDLRFGRSLQNVSGLAGAVTAAAAGGGGTSGAAPPADRPTGTRPGRTQTPAGGGP